ncbi:MAG: hypothetical protein ACOYNY_40445 [Caldilineaceae bacterium]
MRIKELSIIKDETAWKAAKQNALREGRNEGGQEKVREIARITGLSLTEIEQIKLT